MGVSLPRHRVLTAVRESVDRRRSTKPQPPERRTVSMRTVARSNLRRFDLRLLIVIGLSLMLVACNNGGKPAY